MQNKNIFYALGLIVFLVFLIFFFFSAPKSFPVGIIININQGENLREVSLKLKEEQIIRSRLVFEAFVIIYGGEKHLISADYLFESRLSVWQIARRISKGERHLAPVKVTIPEGFNISEIAQVFTSKLSYFNQNEFLLMTKDLEGYLFPDTYFFFTTDGEKEVLKSMTKNFEKKIALIRPEIISSGKTEEEIIKIASIIEKEARGDLDRGFISGILWNRLKIDMLLQVDVAPETYKKKGLPQNPISNPGLKSISAAIHPQISSYFYFLYDKKDNIHYAKSFSEHRQNVLKYLK
ncbi:MAG: Aminodeoxychorismate lyase [Parcubacteria group bacterium GW2011_GWB1_36_5]|nr:MAG: Aminodeoxychorismate lyase [Parcubacteria group bacterium GW2011_GWA2_36_24]KKQ07205.1 MAG: Aminodeoxychorismate lyase [Parcubacteria group bacterium GW2011_GWB1_36_5]